MKPTLSSPSTGARASDDTVAAERPGLQAGPAPGDPAAAPLTHVRGTLLVASRDQMRALDFFSRYEAELSPPARESLTTLIAASWVPVDLALEHFRALDRLDLPTHVIETATGAVAARLQGTLVRTLAAAVQATGGSPLTIVRMVGMLWGRTFQGGHIEVQSSGPREGFVRMTGSPLLASRYHRTGVRVHVQAVAGSFSKNAHVREQVVRSRSNELCLRVQWV